MLKYLPGRNFEKFITIESIFWGRSWELQTVFKELDLGLKFWCRHTHGPHSHGWRLRLRAVLWEGLAEFTKVALGLSKLLISSLLGSEKNFTFKKKMDFQIPSMFFFPLKGETCPLSLFHFIYPFTSLTFLTPVVSSQSSPPFIFNLSR